MLYTCKNSINIAALWRNYKVHELRVSIEDTGMLVARHNDGRSVSMGHSSFDVKPQLGVTPNYFQGSRVPNSGGSCMRVVRDPECSEERKEADVPRGGLRTLDVIATEALLRFRSLETFRNERSHT